MVASFRGEGGSDPHGRAEPLLDADPKASGVQPQRLHHGQPAHTAGSLNLRLVAFAAAVIGAGPLLLELCAKPEGLVLVAAASLSTRQGLIQLRSRFPARLEGLARVALPPV